MVALKTKMKRFITAVFLCAFLLVSGSFLLLHEASANEDVITQLLEMPAPPPPNPLVRNTSRPPEFYDKSKPPKDNAPIEDLLDYWGAQSDGYDALGYNILPSERSLARIMDEIRQKPESLSRFLNIMRDNEDGARLARDLYERHASDETFERDERSEIKNWLMYNSPFFGAELERKAAQVRENREYVSGHDDLLALGRVDWNRAAPIATRLYNDNSQPVSQTAAKWALYRRALDTDSIGDIERYRDELKAIVEDKKASAGMRDMALDALVKEKEWSGRDEWYYTLLGDETLADLRVNGSTYTGLTTIIYHAPKERFKGKMIEFLAGNNQTIRTAAAKNLILMMREPDEEIAKAMLPWLEDPKWLKDLETGRDTLIRSLRQFKIPESVPGLIKVLDEKSSPERQAAYQARDEAIGAAANTMANAANTVANAMIRTTNSKHTLANTANTIANYRLPEEEYPYRSSAIAALEIQADMRAVPVLKRILPQLDEYERNTAVRVILVSGGYTTDEQIDALEAALKVAIVQGENETEIGSMNSSVQYLGYGAASNRGYARLGPVSAADLKHLIGVQLLHIEKVSDDLVKAIIERIVRHDERDPKLAAALRKIVQRWSGTAVNTLLLRELKTGKADTDAVVKLLGIRKDLREKQPNDVYDLRSGSPTGIGISACLIEDPNDLESMIVNENTETTAAMLACARLIRAPLPVPKVAALLDAKDKRLASAAELYLESEDSPEARAAVLARYPNGAKILGATESFKGFSNSSRTSDFLGMLFSSVSSSEAPARYYGSVEYSNNFEEIEKRLQKEVAENQELLGIYWYDDNTVRIYKDKIIFSWDEDDSRFRERPMTKDEFEYLKGYLAHHKVDELKPFLGCEEQCDTTELLMLGQNGGRRVYMNSDETPEFFDGLDKFFDNVKKEPTKLKYGAGKDVAGLEILFADDDLSAETVWKNGNDIRLFVTDKKIRAKVAKEIDEAVEEVQLDSPVTSEDEDDEKSENPYLLGEKLKEKRMLEGISWHKFDGEKLTENAQPPADIDLPPLRDSQTVQATAERWKARTGTLEIRTDADGIYKLVNGKLTKLKTGLYGSPVVSANSRWVVASKFDSDEGAAIVRINLLTGREYKVDLSDYPADSVICFVPTANRFLLGAISYADYHNYDGDSEGSLPSSNYREVSLLYLDAETGALTKPPGDVSPLTQQTFRRLQPGTKPNLFWAAVPDRKKNETVIGVYDVGVFSFKPSVRLPKIMFDSMDMWVDEAQGKAYFVYKGHLLSVPLGK